MAKVFNVLTKVFKKSAHTPDFLSLSEWLINPDLSRVEHLPQRYWKVVEGSGDGYQDGYGLYEMSPAEKTVVDNLEVEERLRSLPQRILPIGSPNKTVFSTNWETVGRFAFLGQSQAKAVITRFYLTAHQTSGGTMSIRVYDVTNAQEIVVLSDFNDTVPTIKDLGLPGNLPQDEAIFEVQAKVSEWTKPAYISSIIII